MKSYFKKNLSMRDKEYLKQQFEEKLLNITDKQTEKNSKRNRCE